MSGKNLEKVIQRAISDAAFRRLLQSNPEAALRGFKLTSEEVSALRASDAGRLMSLGIDQRMSKAFGLSGDTLVNRASVDGLTLGGTAISDQGVARLANEVGGDPPAIGDSAVAPGDAARATMSDASDVAYRVRDVDPVSVGDPLVSPSSDAIEDQSHAFSAGRSAEVETVRSAVRDVEPNDLRADRLDAATGGSPASDAIEDQSHAFSAGRAAEVETVRSAVRDVEPNDLRGGGLVAPVEGSPESFAFQNTDASASDAIEDQSHAFSAGRSADIEAATRSSVRDVAPTDVRGEASEYTAGMDAGRTGSLGTGGEPATPSAVHDVAPADVGMSTSYSGDDLAGPGYLANSGTDDAVRAVRDVTDVDMRGAAATPNLTGDAPFAADPDSAEAYEPTFHSAGTGAPSSDSIEDTSHTFSAARSDAFLSSDEASQYTAGTSDTPGMATDEGQLFNPAADTTAIPEHQGGDAIGNTDTDPHISS